MSRTGQAAASKTRNRPGRRRIVAAAVAAAFPLAAWSQQQLERVEITGSAIKRTDAEGPAPVEIITRKDIAKTGATSINELVRSIPSIDVFDQGELTSNSPSGSGTSQLGLRGLYLEAERLGDRNAARHYAGRAAAVAPQLAWAAESTLEELTERGDWDGALKLVEAQKSTRQIERDAAALLRTRFFQQVR